MSELRPAPLPPFGLGMTALVLGTIGLMLFFLPVLGIPISGLGLVMGLIALVLAPFVKTIPVSWAAAGVAACALALVVNFAVYIAPLGYIKNRPPPDPWHAPPDRPYIPPPARPHTLYLPAGAPPEPARE
jgi:hypothetical protein